MPMTDPDTTLLEAQLRLARNRLSAAESGLFPASVALLDRYRADVDRLEREIRALYNP
jgi:hypothetical protein